MRRSGIKIMTNLILLMKGFISVLVLAITTGVLGFLSGTGILLFGTMAIAKCFGCFEGITTTTLFVIIIGCGVARGLLRYLEQYSNHYIAFKILAVFRDKIFAKLRTLCPAKLESKQKGAIISMITADIEALEVFYAHTLSPVGIAIFSSLAVIVFTWFVCSPYMAMFLLFAYIVIGVIMPLISSKFLGQLGVEYRKHLSDFNGFFMDNIKGINEIILHGRIEQKQQEVEDYTQELINSSDSLNKKGVVFDAISNIVMVALNATLIVIGILLLQMGAVNFGQLIVGVVALLSSYGPVLALNALPNSLSQTFAAGDRVMDLLEETPLVIENQNGKSITLDTVEIEKLQFSYDKNVKVIDDITMSIKKGEIVGIQGESGNGKSTLLKLIMRFWEKDSGNILLQGVDVSNVNAANLKENVTLISQTTYVFAGTVRENLLLAKENATNEEIANACKKANIHNFILTMENGYDTMIGGKNTSLSSGEKQRLGLARAFLRNTKFILLDEPTGNVDSINEGIILKAIVDNTKDKAVILVSHRDSTISIASKVYNLNNGQLHERSNRKEA